MFATITAIVLSANHGSPAACNEKLYGWLSQNIRNDSSILDVGGGTNEVGKYMHKRLKTSNFKWKCIDTFISSDCEKFDGENLKYEKKQFDIVVFNYVLHHAAEKTIPLLRNTLPLLKDDGRVVIVEDIKADFKKMRDYQYRHSGCSHGCMFRESNEWKSLFEMIGYNIKEVIHPSSRCIDWYNIRRDMYILAPK